MSLIHSALTGAQIGSATSAFMLAAAGAPLTGVAIIYGGTALTAQVAKNILSF